MALLGKEKKEEMPTKSKVYAEEYNHCMETVKKTSPITLELMLATAEVDLKIARNDYVRRLACKDAISFVLNKGVPKRHKVK